MKKKTLWWIIGGSVVLLIVIIIIGKNRGSDETKVAIEKSSLRTITETVTASGKIYPETEVKISPEVSGEIIELNIAEGDSVHKGELMARINPAIYSSMVSQAVANVEQNKAHMINSKEMMAQAKASFDQIKATYERNKKLFEDKVISDMEFEQSEANYHSGKAAYEAAIANVSGSNYSVQGASASLNQQKENLRKTTIFSPTSGVVSALNVKLGERVVGTAQMAGTEMMIIADLRRIEVRVEVSETDIAKVKLGDTTIIEADAYRNRKFLGIVSKISVSSKSTGLQQVSSDQVTNYTVRILIFPSSYEDLAKLSKFPFKPGMSASVEIQTRKERNILAVPVNAVAVRDYPDSLKKKNEGFDAVRQVVFVYDEKKKEVNLRDVKTGVQDNMNIQILEGLKDGEEVVIAPYGAVARILKDKTKVKPVTKDQLFETKKEETKD